MTERYERIEFLCGHETLVGLSVSNQNSGPPRVLFLHGAGTATKERALPLAEGLLSSGIPSFCFDFSGHGESTGTLQDSSLAKRTAEAMAAYELLGRNMCPSVCGFSMGGHIALELLSRRPVANLGLFYPAVYAADAFDLPFGDGFTQAIRRPDSWRANVVLDTLKTFRGHLFLAIGTADKVIPRQVIESLYTSSRNASHRDFFHVPGAGHNLLATLNDDAGLMQEVVRRLVWCLGASIESRA